PRLPYGLLLRAPPGRSPPGGARRGLALSQSSHPGRRGAVPPPLRPRDRRHVPAAEPLPSALGRGPVRSSRPGPGSPRSGWPAARRLAAERGPARPPRRNLAAQERASVRRSGHDLLAGLQPDARHSRQRPGALALHRVRRGSGGPEKALAAERSRIPARRTGPRRASKERWRPELEPLRVPLERTRADQPRLALAAQPSRRLAAAEPRELSPLGAPELSGLVLGEAPRPGRPALPRLRALARAPAVPRPPRTDCSAGTSLRRASRHRGLGRTGGLHAVHPPGSPPPPGDPGGPPAAPARDRSRGVGRPPRDGDPPLGADRALSDGRDRGQPHALSAEPVPAVPRRVGRREGPGMANALGLTSSARDLDRSVVARAVEGVAGRAGQLARPVAALLCGERRVLEVAGHLDRRQLVRSDAVAAAGREGSQPERRGHRLRWSGGGERGNGERESEQDDRGESDGPGLAAQR